MALVPHKITALAESDAQGTDGKNIVSGAVVSLYDTSGTVVTLFDDANGSNGSTAKQTDSSGQVVVYVTAGEYDEEVNGSIKRRVQIGNKEITTEQLIDRVRPSQDGDVITTTGFASGGDSGGAQWKATATTGLTPSQAPADRGAAELVDGSGRLWELVSVAGTSNKEVSVYALGAKNDTNCGSIIQAAINSASDGAIVCGADEFIIDQELITNNSLVINGKGATFRAADSLGNDFELLTFESPSMPTRSVKGGVYDVNFKGNNVTPERWLQKLDNTPITDPEADYVAGSGALASGITGVDLTADLDGDSVISVTINSGGSGWNGHPTHPYQSNTVQLKFDGDGFGAKGFATISGGTLTSITIQSGGYGYTTPPTVTTKGGYADISLLVEPTVDRRNPNHKKSANFLRLRGVYDFTVKGCTFSEHVGRAIFEQGGLDVTIEKNVFDGVGKRDQAFHAVYTQSLGTPGAGQSFYSPSENIKIINNRAKNLERSFCAFMPTKGGELSGNYIDGWGESCIFVNKYANFDGGEINIYGNTFINGTITDIVCEAVEPNAVESIFIYENRVENSDGPAFGCAGVTNSQVSKNNLRNIFNNHVTPYGPFSERYSFNNGERPVSGDELHVKDGSYFRIGSFGGVGSDNLVIKENTIVEDRLEYPAVFEQVKSGGNNLSTGLVIENNNLAVPSDMEFLKKEIDGVWDSNIPLFIRNNFGHVSESPVIVSETLNSTGPFVIDCGFRPSKVDVYCADSNLNLGRIAIGSFSWNRDGLRNDFSLYASFDADELTQVGAITGTEVARLTDAAKNITLSIEFSSWRELGFGLNVITASGNKILRFVCHP